MKDCINMTLINADLLITERRDSPYISFLSSEESKTIVWRSLKIELHYHKKQPTITLFEKC
jgi:hypothetical protein